MTPSGAPADRSGDPTTGPPRWVVVCGIVAAVLVLAFVAVMVFGGGHDTGGHTRHGGIGVPASVPSAFGGGGR